MYTHMYSMKKTTTLILASFAILVLCGCFFVNHAYAQRPAVTTTDPNPPICNSSTTSCPPNFNVNFKLNNPLKAATIQDAIKLLMGIVFKLAIPVIILFFIYTGISYILALGNAEKVKKVHTMFFYTVVGTLLILGAYTITNAIVGTVNSVISDNGSSSTGSPLTVSCTIINAGNFVTCCDTTNGSYSKNQAACSHYSGD